jgi:membrane-bound lytic murein transglycosylase B
VVAALAASLLLTLAPTPAQAIPRQPGPLARTLAATTQELETKIAGWLDAGGRGRAPTDVELNALYQQRVYRLLVRKPALAAAVVRRLPRALRAEARANTAAGRDLLRLAPPPTTRRLRVGLPPAADALRRYYREAERRFHVRWEVLAAINFVESRFGRVRSASVAGAEGPMQFLPATWRRYGLGGNVRDPHDAILGAANYLHANGAPRNVSRALLRYNPSQLYVDAVLRYAARIRADRRAFYEYYSRQVYVRTPSGLRRITGPGL